MENTGERWEPLRETGLYVRILEWWRRLCLRGNGCRGTDGSSLMYKRGKPAPWLMFAQAKESQKGHCGGALEAYHIHHTAGFR